MARVLVGVPNPLQGEVPLLLGSYVECEIVTGRSIDGVMVPRTLVREGGFVYTIDVDSKLAVVPIKTGWRYQDAVVVTEGLLGNERLIVSRINTPVEGMLLRVPETADAADKARTAKRGEASEQGSP